MKKMNSIYFDVIDYFDQKKEDTFRDDVQVNGVKSVRREKIISGTSHC